MNNFSLTPIKHEARYKIGEAAKLLGLETYVLRFWETEFPQLEAKRTPSGQRYYIEKDIAILNKIKQLLYSRGMTIAGARQKLDETVKDSLIKEICYELEEIKNILSKDDLSKK